MATEPLLLQIQFVYLDAKEKYFLKFLFPEAFHGDFRLK